MISEAMSLAAVKLRLFLQGTVLTSESRLRFCSSMCSSNLRAKGVVGGVSSSDDG